MAYKVSIGNFRGGQVVSMATARHPQKATSNLQNPLHSTKAISQLPWVRCSTTYPCLVCYTNPFKMGHTHVWIHDYSTLMNNLWSKATHTYNFWLRIRDRYCEANALQIFEGLQFAEQIDIKKTWVLYWYVLDFRKLCSRDLSHCAKHFASSQTITLVCMCMPSSTIVWLLPKYIENRSVTALERKAY